MHPALRRLPALLALLGATAAPAAEAPGLAAARLLPGWVEADGTRVTALELVLEPGWKTYWRSPGEAGVAPHLDWAASGNAGAVTTHWPAPQVIDSEGVETLGFEARLLLPVEIAPAQPGTPVAPRLAVELGLCREQCVPAVLSLDAPPPGSGPDPAIAAALAAGPRPGPAPRCEVAEIADGLRVRVTLPEAPETQAAALELEGVPGLWVSQPELARGAGGLTATAELVAPSGKPFALDRGALRLTLVGPAGATEHAGCAS